MREIGVEFPARGQAALFDLGPHPQPAPTEIVIETVYSAITNGTERHALVGEHGWGVYPGRHGYQHVGRVIATGGEVADFAVGDWVFHGRYVGHRGWHVVDVAAGDKEAIESHLTLRLPAQVDRRDCALLGVAGVGLRGIRRIRTQPGQRVWVAGAGPIGNFSAQAARLLGAEVTVTDLAPRRLEVALQTGARSALSAADDGVWQALAAAGPFDRIVDACGAPGLLHDIYQHRLLARGGVIALMAVRAEAVFPWGLLHSTEGSIEVACHFSLADLRDLIAYLREGRLQIAPLVTHRVRIEQVPALYALLRDRPQELLGVIFEWQ